MSMTETIKETTIRLLCLLPFLITLSVISPDLTQRQWWFINVALVVSLGLYDSFVPKRKDSWGVGWWRRAQPVESDVELQEALIDMVLQHCCGADGLLRDYALSANEAALSCLERHGYVESVEDGLFVWVNDAL